MSTTYRVLVIVLCATILPMMVGGCAALTPEVITVQATVVVTATLLEKTAAPQPPAEEPAATPVPMPPTPELPATTPPLPTVVPTSLPPSAAEPPYEDRQDPIRLLASYYNAINRQEYQRAWEYWETPPSPSYEDFVEGFADTASVLLVVRPPAHEEGAAGSRYAAIPTLLSATHSDNSEHNFVGCFVARRSNLGGPGAGEEWSLYDATISVAPGNSTDVSLLAQACPDAPELWYDDRSDPIRLLASYYDGINRQEYQRAWDYWESPPNPSYEDFVQGFAETDSVLLAVRPPTTTEGAAGSVYAAIPALMSATHLDNSEHNFVGCFVVRRSNLGEGEEWWLYNAMVAVSPGNSADVTLLAAACDGP